MDKPLSQERLSEEDLRIAKLFQVPAHSFAFTFKYGPKLIAEIERLQAIEAERNELREIIDRQHVLLDNYETILNIGSC